MRNRIQLDRFDLLFLLQAVFKEKSVFSGIPIAAAKLVGDLGEIHAGVHAMGPEEAGGAGKRGAGNGGGMLEA